MIHAEHKTKCSDSVALQQAFFSRRQEEWETLWSSPSPWRVSWRRWSSVHLLQCQMLKLFWETGLLRMFWIAPCAASWSSNSTLLDVTAEERKGLPGGVRSCSYSVPSVFSVQYDVQGGPQASFPNAQCLKWAKWKRCLSVSKSSSFSSLKALLGYRTPNIVVHLVMAP